MALLGFLGRRRHERTAFQLYGSAVAAARHPFFYERLGVPDTLDGRFDLVGLHTCMLIRRLRGLPPPGNALAQAVFDAMFSDMDTNLREIGVSDMRLARNVRAMWEAFHGRALAYEAAFAAPDPGALEQALVRNVWRGEAAAGAPGLAAVTRERMAAVEATPVAELMAGQMRFPEPVAA